MTTVQAGLFNNLKNIFRSDNKQQQNVKTEDKCPPQIIDPRDLLGAKNMAKEAWIPNKDIILPNKKIIVPNKKIILPKKRLDTIDTSKMVKVNEGNAVNVLPPTIYADYLYPGSKIEFFNSKDQTESVLKLSKEEVTKNGICNSKEEMTISSKNQNIGIKKVEDYEHNSTTLIKIKNPLDYKNIKYLKQVTEYRDKDNNPEKIVVYKASDIAGVFNVTEKNPKTGEIKKLCEVIKNENGSYSIKKDLVSLDGTRTQSVLEKDETGNHSKLNKTITDKDGNILAKFSRTYDRINANLAYSSVNNHQYKIENTPGKVTVTDMATKEIKTIGVNDFKKASFKDEGYDVQWKDLDAKIGMEDDKHINYLFKKLPGDTLINLAKDVEYITRTKSDLESFFWRVDDNTMLNCGTKLMVVNHELGHAHDIQYNEENPDNYSPMRYKNEEFKKCYENERRAFIEKFPGFEEKYIDYFIFAPETQKYRGQSETVAETNAINGLAPENMGLLAMRTIYLEQYFPKTIATITNAQNSIHVPDEVYQNRMTEGLQYLHSKNAENKNISKK